jgi:hypothetical protein
MAKALLGSNVRNFMISYVMLQCKLLASHPKANSLAALGLMPMQLLNIGPVFTLTWSRITACKTPRSALLSLRFYVYRADTKITPSLTRRRC